MDGLIAQLVVWKHPIADISARMLHAACFEMICAAVLDC